MSTWAIHEGDVLAMLATLPDSSFDGLLSDVPYGLGPREPSVNELIAYLTCDAALNTGGDFMGKKWSVPSVAVWREIYRVLTPGAHLLVFAGTRTLDLITLGMRAGGFEVRDSLVWMYGSGFPKSLDVSKAIDKANGDKREVVSETVSRFSGRQSDSIGRESREKTVDGKIINRITSAASAASAAWDGYGTALKPAFEPYVLARKPLDGTVAANVLKWGCGALAIDACRVGYASDGDMAAAAAAQRLGQGNHGAAVGVFGLHDPGRASASLQPYLDKQAAGRWPANVVLSHADECRQVGTRKVKSPNGASDYTPTGVQGPTSIIRNVKSGAHFGDADGTETVEAWDCVPDCPVAMLDAQSGDRPGMSGGGVHSADYGGGIFGGIDSASTARGDSGGASRFFYTAKASRTEREFGCEALPARTGAAAVEREEDSAGVQNPRAGAGRTADRVRNHHPTVKPIALAKYLATLILPPPHCAPRRLLVTYSGSGSEMIGAIRAGWDEVVGIEREAEYVAIARARLDRWAHVRPDLDEETVAAAAEKSDPKQTSLFAPSPPARLLSAPEPAKMDDHGRPIPEAEFEPIDRDATGDVVDCLAEPQS
jgi:DNA modification methylase